jgi:ADP-ribose pyrophosphatase
VRPRLGTQFTGAARKAGAQTGVRTDGLPGTLLAADDLIDRPERWAVRDRKVTLDTGRVVSVRRDRVASAGGSAFSRDVVVHPGAVGVIALDDADRVLLVSQYRHPVGHRLLEPPAGLLDVDGEHYLDVAERELAEEGHVRAEDWRVLVDPFTSPGMTDEAVRIFLARRLRSVPVDERFVGEHEEADLPICWAPLDAVVSAVLTGGVHNPLLVIGALACFAAQRTTGLDRLRAADAPWRVRQDLPHH